MATYTILKGFVNRLDKRVDRFSRKFKDATISYTKSEPYMMDKIGHSMYGHEVVDVELNASYQIKGYEFIAKLEWNDEVKANIVKTAIGDPEIPERYLTSCTCEHCSIERPRNHTILLKNTENGKFIQVGSTCVKSYLGIDVEKYAMFLEDLSSIDDDIERDCAEWLHENPVTVYDTDEVLLDAIAQSRVYGYRGSSTWEREYESSRDPETIVETTATVVEARLNHTMKFLRHSFEEVEVTEEDRKALEDLKEYVENLNDSGSLYYHNLKTALKSSIIRVADLKLAVSAVGTYNHYLKEKEIEDANLARGINYLGDVGEKITITGIPERVTSSYGDYGMTYLYKFTPEGGEVLWWTNKCLEEKEITITGTIKDLKDYKGIKQTVVTRCRIMEKA